ncbi:MAG: NUDIX domain-containing protein [Verrucomicrobiota bacterium]
MAHSISAGLLLYSQSSGTLQVLLAHPGGPYFARKDLGAWTLPKGLVEPGENLLSTAQREFTEETGYDLNEVSTYLPLGSITQKGGKEVHAWAFEGSWEAGRLPESNTFTMEWPPKSGTHHEFPEIDRAELFSLEEAEQKINERQRPFLARLVEALHPDP